MAFSVFILFLFILYYILIKSVALEYVQDCFELLTKYIQTRVERFRDIGTIRARGPTQSITRQRNNAVNLLFSFLFF